MGEADGSFDVATLAGAGPVLPADAVWRWASITKQLTAVLVMQQVEQGKLDLDKPVSAYWPQWRSANAGSIRIRDLMGHMSGLPDPDNSAPLPPSGFPGFYGTNAAAPSASADGFCAGPGRDAPGKSFLYNNCDYIVLGEILSRVTGKPFAELAAQKLAQPTGMTGFGIYRFGEARPAHVTATGEDVELDLKLDLGLYGAAGGAFGPITDLWRFDHALLNGQLLGEGARTTMWTPVKKDGFAALGQWAWPLELKRCGRTITVVERQGQIGAFEMRNYLIPGQKRALILFARKKPAYFGEPWELKGLAYDLLEEGGANDRALVKRPLPW